MKKLLFFLFITIFVVACNVSPPDPPDPPAVIDFEFFTIVGIAGPNGTVTPSKVFVEKGQSASFTLNPNPGYLTESIKHTGDIFPPVSVYTISNITKDDSFEVSFKKDSLLWPLLNITWKQVGFFSLKEGGEWVEWDISKDKEVLNFYSDGSYSQSWNGNIYQEKWSLDKTKSPAILTRIGYASFTLEVLTEKNMSISYVNSQNIRTRKTYVNAGYKN